MQRVNRKEAREYKGRKRWNVAMVVTLMVMAGAVSAASAMAKKEPDASPAAVDAFIWFSEPHTAIVMTLVLVEGRESGDTHAFEINDFSFGVENPTTIGSATGGAGAGKIKFNEFTIKKTTDKASPALFKNCASGAHYSDVVLELRKVDVRKPGGAAGAGGMPFVTYRFDTVFTTKIDWSGPGDEGPEESITFVYGKLGVKYHAQMPGEESSFAGWDQIQNKDWSEGDQ